MDAIAVGVSADSAGLPHSTMPSAAKKPCVVAGCPELTSSGPCPTHARQREQRRGSARSRGYNAAWEHFRAETFPALLLEHGLAPMCGAALSYGPSMVYSQCRAAGLHVFDRLNLDHEPPITDAERALPTYERNQVMCDPSRVGYLCSDCHSAKTRHEQRKCHLGVTK